MSNGETIHSGVDQASGLCSPKPSKSNISQGINTFLKENGFSVSPMNFSSKFADEQFPHPIDPPPVISLMTDNPSNGLKQEGFYQNFSNIIQSLNPASVSKDMCFSELDIASQKIMSQEHQEAIQDFGDSGLGNNSEDRNPSMFQRAYQSDQKKKRDQEELLQDQNETESCNNSNKEQQDEIDTKNHDHPSAVESCKCTNSKCLKLYCVCFSQGIFCQPTCKCISCSNTSSNCIEVKEARKNTLSRNPQAFTSKVEVVFAAGSKSSFISDLSELEGSRAMFGYKKGCKCKKTFCRKKYCECFNAGVKCSYICVCEECHNKEQEGKDGGEHKNIERNANEIDQLTVAQENQKINKRPYEPSNESAEEQYQVQHTLHKPSDGSCFAVRKKQKIEDKEEEININGQGQNIILQKQSHEDINQLEQQGQQNQVVKQLLFECETPTFKILNKQDFDPNSIIRKNIPNSTFTLDS